MIEHPGFFQKVCTPSHVGPNTSMNLENFHTHRRGSTCYACWGGGWCYRIPPLSVKRIQRPLANFRLVSYLMEDNWQFLPSNKVNVGQGWRLSTFCWVQGLLLAGSLLHPVMASKAGGGGGVRVWALLCSDNWQGPLGGLFSIPQ